MRHPASRFVLLLTATITPPPGVSMRADPAVRLEDYRRSLLFYLVLLGREQLAAIVFVDNSNSDLSVLVAEARAAGLERRCEFISFDGLDYPVEYGYGYGEFKLLDHGMRHAAAVHEPNVVVVKVTGRYILHNLAGLLRRLPEHYDVVCDVRNRRRPWADMRVMVWTPAGYEAVLRGVYARLRDDLTGFPPEMLMSQHLLGMSGSNAIVDRLPSEPFLSGFRGYDGKNWARGSLLAKLCARVVLRRLLFWYPV
jgi:hypothetical protein